MADRKRPSFLPEDEPRRFPRSTARSTSAGGERVSARSSSRGDAPSAPRSRASEARTASQRTSRSTRASQSSARQHVQRRDAAASSRSATQDRSRTRRSTSRDASERTTPSYASPGLWTKDQPRRSSRVEGARSASSSGAQGILQTILGVLAAVFTAIGRGIVFLVHSLISLCIRSRAALIALIAVIVIGGGALLDFGLNNGKAYPGVKVGGIDVSGKSESEIATLVSDAYQGRLDSTTVTVFANEEARQKVNDAAAQAQDAALAQQLSVEEARANRQLWTADAATVGASIPAEDLAKSALEVGRGDGGVLARISALFGGWNVGMKLSYDGEKLESLASEIDASIGNPRVDCSIEVVDGVASVVEGHDGMMVNRDWLADSLCAAFLESEDPSFIATTEYAPLRIDQSAAQAVCDQVNAAIEPGAVLSYENATWSVDRTELGSCVATRVEERDGGHALVPYLDDSKAKPFILADAQEHHDGARAAVSFQKNDDGSFRVTTDGNGRVPLTAEAVQALNDVLFYGKASSDVAPASIADRNAGTTHAERASDGEPVSVTLTMGSTPTELSFDDALSAGIVSQISSFTTEYSSGAGTENRNHNIHLVSDLLNGSIVEPEGVWSYNETAGNCNEEAGFLGAGSIVNGEYTDEVGGGICQVATTVFNAVYEAGLPVVSRSNHSLYIASYPAGRDAAVSWPDLDLKWSNDSQSDILLLMTYTDTTVTATLYGVPLGYTVTSEVGEWQEGDKYDTRTEVDDSLAPGTRYVKTAGSDGSSISVIRTVTDSDGNMVRQDRFDSIYDSITEVIVEGPSQS